jgi:hypothetical protein
MLLRAASEIENNLLSNIQKRPARKAFGARGASPSMRERRIKLRPLCPITLEQARFGSADCQLPIADLPLGYSQFIKYLAQNSLNLI